jgi:predicted amidophosphoribosyltransferase
MAALVAGVDGLDTSVVTWAPTSRARQRERGFDQAELLARAVARELHRPCRALLRRMPGPPQTGRPARDRASGVTFAPRGVRRGCPPRVLLVDDVLTTGATLSAAANALTTIGATSLVAVTAARTPLKVLG